MDKSMFKKVSLFLLISALMMSQVSFSAPAKNRAVLPVDPALAVKNNTDEKIIDVNSIEEKGIKAFAGKAQVIKLNNPVSRVAIGDPRVLDYILISPKQLYVIGKTIGTTNMIIWYTNGESFTTEIDVSFDLTNLKRLLKRDLPAEEDIHIDASSGSLVLSGSVSNTLVAGTLINMTEAYLRNIGRSTNNISQGSENSSSAVASSFTGKGGNFSVNIINLIKIRDPQQVMLEVKIASVDKNLLNKLGVRTSSGTSRNKEVNYSVLSSGGGTNPSATNTSTVVAGTTPPVSPLLAGGLIAGLSPTASFLNLLIGDRNGRTQLGINADQLDSMVRVLAEPNIVTMSGQEGRFLKGGKIFIPVPQATSSGGTSITLSEKEFGIGVRFIPTVLDGGRINLKVSPEVSSLSQTGVSASASAGGGGSTFPAFEMKSVSTTVQLNNGQTLVIGGLLDDETIAEMNGIPGLSNIPFFGALFRNTALSKTKTELVIVVKASLVKATDEPAKLPTDIVKSPDNIDMLVTGNLESTLGPQDGAKNTEPVKQTSKAPENVAIVDNTEIVAQPKKANNLFDYFRSKSKGN
jgi:pilus assembly protein CpaC